MKRLLIYLFPVLILLELCIYTLFVRKLPHYLAATLFFSISIAIPFIAWKIKEEDLSLFKLNGKWLKWIGVILSVCSLVMINWFSERVAYIQHDAHAAKMTNSDIIPQLMILVERFLAGEFPYQNIRWNYTLFPTYLPLQWLPYTIPELLDFDYRTFSFGVFVLAVLFFIREQLKEQLKKGVVLFSLLFPVLFMYLWVYNNTYTTAVTSEFLIGAYYFVLAYAIATKNRTLLLLSVVFCLFSRYAIVLWVPAWLFYEFYFEGKERVVKSMIFLFIGGVITYGSFLIIDPTIYFQGYGYHTKAAAAEWKKQLTGGGHYHNGIGFASLFEDFLSGDIMEKLKLWQKLHLVLSLASVIVPAVLIWMKRIHVSKEDIPLFLLVSLKIYLVVFYHFIQIPYPYLYIVPVVVSYPLLLLMTRRGI